MANNPKKKVFDLLKTTTNIKISLFLYFPFALKTNIDLGETFRIFFCCRDKKGFLFQSSVQKYSDNLG